MIYSTGKNHHFNKSVMKEIFFRVFLILILLSICFTGFSQDKSKDFKSSGAIIDSLSLNRLILDKNRKGPVISLSKDQSVKFLQQRTQTQFWNDPHDPFRLALSHLIFEASHPRFDSAEYLLKNYPYDSLKIPWDKFYIWEPLRLKIPYTTLPESGLPVDSAVKSDSMRVFAFNDSLNLNQVSAASGTGKNPATGLKDTTILVVIDTLNEVTSTVSKFPFRYLNFPYQSDSIEVAVNSLLNYLEERDSSVIYLTGTKKTVIPVWMNSKNSKVIRYWLKNELSDSVTVWIANPERNTIGLYLEQGVSFRRPVRQGNYSEARIDVPEIDNTKLHEVQNIMIKPQYWKYRSEASLVFSQTAISNWVKGGENSVSALMDVTGYADYNNKALKLSSKNFARIKLGFQKSGNEKIKKNVDLIETNSKLNHKAFGKFDFSAIMLFKTQLGPGYNYTKIEDRDTAILVSKMFNPAILTIGLGLDYKPNKTTSINFSPFSYKGTFVPSAEIDQTKYGIAKDKKSLNEPGISVLVTNEYKPFKSVTVINRLQLFTNYIHNPQNVDVDWEAIVTANLNWFTDVRFNTHLIFDDDTKTVDPDEKNPDGTPKKTARIQFKEILGLSLVFRF
jgi:hypothetical protein